MSVAPYFTIRTVPVAFAAMALCSCQEQERLVYTSDAIELVASGPLFEGTNTAQAEWNHGLEAYLKEHGHAMKDLREARLTSATLSSADSTGLHGIRSATVQWVGGGTPMQQMAVRNPIPEDSTAVLLTVATEQPDLLELLGTSPLTVVADLDIDADSDLDRRVIGRFTLELIVEP